MISNINLLSSVLEISQNNSTGCTCESSSTDFDTIITSLLSSQLQSSLSSSSNSSSSDYSSTGTGLEIAMLSLLKAVATKNAYTASSTTNQSSVEINTSTESEEVESVYNTNEYVGLDSRIENAITVASQTYGVDENLIKSIIKVESNFDVNAQSSAGAKGLMQIMPSNYSSLGITDPFNIEQNINGGTKLLKEYMNMYDGDVEMALMAYNGGPGRMKNRGVTSASDLYKMPNETQNYVSKVMNYYEV